MGGGSNTLRAGEWKATTEGTWEKICTSRRDKVPVLGRGDARREQQGAKRQHALITGTHTWSPRNPWGLSVCCPFADKRQLSWARYTPAPGHRHSNSSRVRSQIHHLSCDFRIKHSDFLPFYFSYSLGNFLDLIFQHFNR